MFVNTRFLFFMLIFLMAQSALAFSMANAAELCPRTTSFYEEPRKSATECRDVKLPSIACMGEVERMAISFAELNGYISGTPVLWFKSGSSNLAVARSECLGRFANVYAKAIKATGFTTNTGSSLAIRIIGHADGPKSPNLNFKISYDRALYVREKLVALLNRELGWSRNYLRTLISAEGRGEEDPWWCGADKQCEFRDLALAATPGSSGPDPDTVSVNQDRRVEMRLTAAEILAGPRLVSFMGSGNNGWRLAFDDARMRLYPAGTQPLTPVSLTLVERDSDRSKRVCQIVDGEDVDNGQNAPAATSPWLDTDWQHLSISKLSKLEPRSFEGETLEANLFIRLRAIPAVTSRGKTNPQKVRLVLDVASMLVSHQPAPPNQNASEASTVAVEKEPVTAANAVPQPLSGLEEAKVIRGDLGLGIPDYWLARLRINGHLSDVLNKDKHSAAWSDCIKSFVPPEEFAGKIEVGDRVARFPDWVTRFVLAHIPKDFDGLSAHLYDFNPRVAMFGLRPGHELRFITGDLMLPIPLQQSDPSFGRSAAVVGSSFKLPLYAAPTSILFGRPGRPNTARKDWTDIEKTTFGGDVNLLRRSGPEGNLAVTLDPGIQRFWGLKNHLFDYRNLPSREVSQIPELASIQHLERFLRGRVVRVFLPHGNTTKPKMQEIQSGKFSDKLDARENRDVILVAADQRDLLDAFLTRYNLDDELTTNENDPIAICRDANDEVYCGYFRQPLSLSLHLEATISGKLLSVPLGTALGNLMKPRALSPCFLKTAKKSRAHGRFEIADRLADPIRIGKLSDLLAAPDLFDDDDCRLLGLPVLGGGRMDLP